MSFKAPFQASNIIGTVGVANGGTGSTSFTAGSIIFSNGTILTQDNSSLFFDDTNNRLGLLTTAPTHTLTLGSTATGIALYNTVDQVTNYERIRMQWVSNVFYITGGRGGATSTRNIRIGVNSSGDTDGGNSYINYGADSITYNIRSGSGASQGHFFTVGANTSSSGTHTLVSITESVAQSGTGAYTGLLVNITETSTGSGAKNLILAQVGGVTKFGVDNAGVVTFGNAVTAGIAVASTHRIAVVDGGTTYYLLATTVA